MNREEFQNFSEFLRERSGVSLDPSKQYLVEARMAPLVEAAKLGSLAALVDRLRESEDPDLETRVVDEMMTNDTSFFRDVKPFEILRTEILPAQILTRDKERRLQIWSAACASGQEAYSIAILLLESFPELADWSIDFLATDISQAAIEKARNGSYSQLEVNRGLPPDLLRKYFTQSGIRWKVNDELREMVEFRELNLVSPLFEIPRADIVFARNVLLYFESDLKQKTLGLLRESMAPDAALFLGRAESPVGLDHELVRVEGPPANSCFRIRED